MHPVCEGKKSTRSPRHRQFPPPLQPAFPPPEVRSCVPPPPPTANSPQAAVGLPAGDPSFAQQHYFPRQVLLLQPTTLVMSPSLLSYTHPFVPPFAPPKAVVDPFQTVNATTRPKTTSPGEQMPQLFGRFECARDQKPLAAMNENSPPPNEWPQLSPNAVPSCSFGNCLPDSVTRKAYSSAPPVEDDFGPARASSPRPPSRRSYLGDLTASRASTVPLEQPTPRYPYRAAQLTPPAERYGVPLHEPGELVLSRVSLQLNLHRVKHDRLMSLMKGSLSGLYSDGCSEHQFHLLNKWRSRVEIVQGEMSELEVEMSRLARELQSISDRWKATLQRINHDWNMEMPALRECLFDVDDDRMKFADDKRATGFTSRERHTATATVDHLYG